MNDHIHDHPVPRTRVGIPSGERRLHTDKAARYRNLSLVCRRVLDEVCNQEDHAALLELLPGDSVVVDGDVLHRGHWRGPLPFLDVLNTYKEFVPDLLFSVV